MKEIVQEGAPILREVAKPIPENLFNSAELKSLVRDMSEALDAFPEGVALAAPQVGVSYRLFIVRKDRTISPPENEEERPKKVAPEIEVYLNPEVVKTSRKKAHVDEGCLSVQGVYGTTTRHERVTIKARGLDGSHISRGAGGLMAQIFEHEIDHLNGILFTDHAENFIHISHKPSHTFAFFGTPGVARDTLEFLLERDFIPAVVITSPDAPKGRGLTLTPSETKLLALEHNIPVLTPEKLDAKTMETITAFNCDYAICVAYGKIFPEALIDSFPLGVLNVHYSLLPKYRGATPLETALLSNDTETGVTVQKMVKELDAGDILAQQSVKIAPDETARELRPRLITLGSHLLADTLPAFTSGELTPRTQDVSQAIRAHKIKKEDGLLSLDAPAQENWNKYRAYADSIGTYFFEKGKRMKITEASFKNNAFTVERVIPEGKREMAYADFARNS